MNFKVDQDEFMDRINTIRLILQFYEFTDFFFYIPFHFKCRDLVFSESILLFFTVDPPICQYILDNLFPNEKQTKQQKYGST